MKSNHPITHKLIILFISSIFFQVTSAQSIQYNWGYLKGFSTPDFQTSVYGTVGVTNIANRPGARDSYASWVKDDSVFIYGGVGHSISQLYDASLDDLWVLANGSWTWLKGAIDPNSVPYGVYGIMGVPALTNNPGGRFYSATWKKGDTLFLFGGNGLGEFCGTWLNDLWAYSKGNWIWMKGSKNCDQLGNYGTLGVASSTNNPGGREGSITWVKDDTLFLFGGNGRDAVNAHGRLNDLWAYANGNWVWLKGSNAVNQNGVYGAQGIADLNNNPGGRYLSVSWLKSDTLFLFGGAGQNASGSGARNLNDLWAYANGSWVWLKGSNAGTQSANYGIMGIMTSSNDPGSRVTSYGWMMNDTLFLFGGQGFDLSSMSYLNDLWAYANGNWIWVKGPNSINSFGVYPTIGVDSSSAYPGGRVAGVSFIKGDTMFIHGGYGRYSAGAVDQLNDLWYIDKCNTTPGNTNLSVVQNISVDQGINSDCIVIGRIVPNGASPVSGDVSSKVWIENSVLSHNGQPYVQRHYELTPTNNASTATATVTLFFTQTEFTNYNNDPGSSFDLPIDAADVLNNKTNLRVLKITGSSLNLTGLPSSYTGPEEVIDPDDANIIWNSSLNMWQVTFDVVGFSGFFVQASSSALPVKLINFFGKPMANDVLLSWQTAGEINFNHFKIERSIDGINFTAIADRLPLGGNGIKSYELTDIGAASLRDKLYYRLKMIDRDGSFEYSRILMIRFSQKNIEVTDVYPNPVKDKLSIVISGSSNKSLSIELLDIYGRKLKKEIFNGAGSYTIDLNSLSNGVYMLRVDNGQLFKVIKSN